MEDHSLSSPARVSQSLQFLRASAIRDLQRSEEFSRITFCLLFALIAIAVSLVVTPPGADRLAAWLLAAALLVDGVAAMALLAHRTRRPAAVTMLEFISREHRHVETRLRCERYSRRLMLVLAGFALLLLILAPRPISVRENALDLLGRMIVLTAFLAVAWRKGKSRSGEIRGELERYLKDLSAQ